MDDFRLKVFVSAAKNLNFSKSALEMDISQPAVSKHISEIEWQFGVPLFNRSAGKVALTKAGKVFLAHAERILASYREMEYEMSFLGKASRGHLTIGASTTIAQYLLPPILAKFIERFDGVEVSMKSGNSDSVEQWLLSGEIDVGLVENASRRSGIHYEHLLDDELVLVAGTRGRLGHTESIKPEHLKRIALVLREKGSGTREIIEEHLSEHGIAAKDLKAVIELSSTEAIKSFVANSDAAAIVSVISIRDELANGSLKIIDIDECDMPRVFATAFRQGEFNGIREQFHLFAKHYASIR